MILMIIVNMYQSTFLVSPFYSQFYVALMTFPIIFQFFYALFSETVPFYNSTCRSYLMLMSIVQVITCIITTVSAETVTATTLLLTLTMFSIAWIDALSDGLLVVA